MLSVRPRELRLVIQHQEAAMMTISCSSFIFYRLFARAYIIVLYSHVRRKLSINGYYFIFLAYANVCSVTELT